MRCVLLCMLKVVEGVLCLLEVPKVPAVMHYVLLRVQEVVEGSLRLLEVLEVMRCVLLCILEAVEGGLCLLEGVGEMGGVGGGAVCVVACGGVCDGWVVWGALLGMLEVVEGVLYLLEVPETLCMLLCMLEAVEGGLCLLDALDALGVLEVPEVMRCAVRCSVC